MNKDFLLKDECKSPNKWKTQTQRFKNLQNSRRKQLGAKIWIDELKDLSYFDVYARSKKAFEEYERGINILPFKEQVAGTTQTGKASSFSINKKKKKIIEAFNDTSYYFTKRKDYFKALNLIGSLAWPIPRQPQLPGEELLRSMRAAAEGNIQSQVNDIPILDNRLINFSVGVFWDVHKYYEGIITKFNEESNVYTISYKDGDIKKYIIYWNNNKSSFEANRYNTNHLSKLVLIGTPVGTPKNH